MPTLGDENICWLDVAVYDALHMRRIQSICNLDGQTEKNFWIEWSPGDEMFEGFAIEVFHGDECMAILLADVVDSANIGMIQCRSGLRFPLETSQGLGVAGNFVRQKFQSDEAMQTGIFCFVDNAHTAATKLFDDPVVGNSLPNHGCYQLLYSDSVANRFIFYE